MRTLAKVAAGMLLFGAGAGVGYGVGQLVEPSNKGINDAEHDRLVDACVVSSDGDGAGCAAWVADLVDFVEGKGCGYGQAAQLLDIGMTHPDEESEALDALGDEVLAGCSD